MPVQLVALNEGPNIFLDKPILLFGREEECDIRFESRKISRKHCCLAQVGERLVVRDLGSTNGIRINGVRVVEGNLKAGDELTIGNHRYEVRWDTPGNAKGRAAIEHVNPFELEPRDQAGQLSEDDALEDCDEPVPLKEPSGLQKAVSKRKTQLDGPTPDDRGPGFESKPDQPPQPPNVDDINLDILPEDIGLAPSSHAMRKPKPPSSAS